MDGWQARPRLFLVFSVAKKTTRPSNVGKLLRAVVYQDFQDKIPLHTPHKVKSMRTDWCIKRAGTAVLTPARLNRPSLSVHPQPDPRGLPPISPSHASRNCGPPTYRHRPERCIGLLMPQTFSHPKSDRPGPYSQYFISYLPRHLGHSNTQ